MSGFKSDAQRKHFFANGGGVSGFGVAVAVAKSLIPSRSVRQPVSAGFDQHDKASYTAAHWTAHQAGMSNIRDRVGEESWTTEQWLAFDAGRDDAHEAYLKATGTA